MARSASKAAQVYTKAHWGVDPGVVYEVDDDDLPPQLTQMGILLELRVSAGPTPHRRGRTVFDIDFSRFRPPCHLAFSPDRAQRLYNVLTPAAQRACRTNLWVEGEPTYLLGELAELAPGRQNRWDYPEVDVQCLGWCVNVVYRTEKKGDGLSEYTHAVGEENGKFPLLALDRLGRLWWTGGDYAVPADGITN